MGDGPLEQVEALFDATIARFGRVDCLVNNAGIAEPRPLLEMSAAERDKALQVTLDGAFICTWPAVREMIRQGDGG